MKSENWKELDSLWNVQETFSRGFFGICCCCCCCCFILCWFVLFSLDIDVKSYLPWVPCTWEDRLYLQALLYWASNSLSWSSFPHVLALFSNSSVELTYWGFRALWEVLPIVNIYSYFHNNEPCAFWLEEAGHFSPISLNLKAGV